MSEIDEIRQGRASEINKKAMEYANCPLDWYNDRSYVGETNPWDDAHSFEDGANWADINPSVETMLRLFWFFDKHGLIRDDLCFDPQHFMETVAKEHFPDFDIEDYFKNRK